MAQVRRKRQSWRVLSWTLAIVCVPLGGYVGWNHDAGLGIWLWIAATVLALLPFLSHRDGG